MRLDRLHILVVGADVADVREGEGDDLLGVGRVGHHFLVTGHRRVEAQLADRLALGPEPLPPDRPAVGEHHDSRRALGLGRGRGIGVGHGFCGAFRQGFFSYVAKEPSLSTRRREVNAVKSPRLPLGPAR